MCVCVCCYYYHCYHYYCYCYVRKCDAMLGPLTRMSHRRTSISTSSRPGKLTQRRRRWKPVLCCFHCLELLLGLFLGLFLAFLLCFLLFCVDLLCGGVLSWGSIALVLALLMRSIAAVAIEHRQNLPLSWGIISPQFSNWHCIKFQSWFGQLIIECRIEFVVELCIQHNIYKWIYNV